MLVSTLQKKEIKLKIKTADIEKDSTLMYNRSKNKRRVLYEL